MELTEGRILVLDDESLVTTTLGSLLELESPWSVSAFGCARDALAELERTRFDAVVSDFLMPDMDGVEFLARARALQPIVSRILLTGYADKANAIRGINDAGLYYYVEKPWDNDRLLLVLRNAVERTQLLRQVDDKVSSLASVDRDLADIRARLLKTLL